MSDDRHSTAADAELVSDPDERARIEARNALRQFDEVVALIQHWTESDHPPFRLRPSTILHLHRVVLEGLTAFAGNFRPSSIEIGGSKLRPVDALCAGGGRILLRLRQRELVVEVCDPLGGLRTLEAELDSPVRGRKRPHRQGRVLPHPLREVGLSTPWCTHDP